MMLTLGVFTADPQPGTPTAKWRGSPPWTVAAAVCDPTLTWADGALQLDIGQCEHLDDESHRRPAWEVIEGELVARFDP